MKFIRSLMLVLFFPLGVIHGQEIEDPDIAELYIRKWKEFYPSKAVNSGIHSSIFQYEDRSKAAIENWIQFNRKIVTVVTDSDATFTKRYPIDARLLRVQAQSEVDEWDQLRVMESDLMMYLNLIKEAIPGIFEASYLTKSEQLALIKDRLTTIGKLATSARHNLQWVSTQTVEVYSDYFESSINSLNSLDSLLQARGYSYNQLNIEERIESALNAITSLDLHLTALSKEAKPSNDILGRKEYARKLALYTDSDLTPEELAEIALDEIQTVRGLMENVATAYIQEAYPEEKLPKSFEERLEKALADMGKDVPLNGADYEQFWNELAVKAIAFVEAKGLGTLPENQTLSIRSAPESAGPAARIGWVGSAPPFDPNPWTTLYLPSIPETLPEQEQKDFWASFNKPFNRIIVIHELFPGHYMQLKISRETAHPIRLLFPYGTYIEGWATFCERVALDEGWDDGNHMTMLAHLRKRIENANRAYTSVQVHTNGWTKDQVMKFSTETSLVAPQFAKSLWFRLMRSPMQLTSYFLGGAQFTELMEEEKERLGDRFDLTLFMDTIMKSGPIPIDEFEDIFAQTK